MAKSIYFLLALILVSCNFFEKEPAVTTGSNSLEFGSMHYTEICHDQLKELSAADMDKFLNVFAEDVIYRFNNGDSIVGKAAVEQYWRDRRANVIDKIEFTNVIWLPLEVNDTTQGVRQGVWVLGWYKTNSTYKTGKSVSQFIHTMYHFNSNEKVDEVIQYFDRLPIMEANRKQD